MKLAKITLLFITLIISEISFSQVVYEKDIFRKEIGKFADLDNDGIMDMVTRLNEINLHRGKPNLEYYLPKYIDTCVSVVNSTYVYFDFYLEDYNNDGLKDILCLSNHDNNITYYENKGNLSFQKHELYSEVGEYRNFMVYDVNLDGKLDFLFIKDNQLIYKSQVNGGLDTNVIVFPNIQANDFFTHLDLNSDGRQDLVYHRPDHVNTFYNLPTNFFSPESYFGAGNNYGPSVAYDFDQDGASDMVTFAFMDLVFQHNLDSMYHYDIDYIPMNINFTNARVKLVQLDNDPEPEILVLNVSPDRLYKIDYNSSTDSFDAPILLSNYFFSSTDDIDNDGDNDIIILNSFGLLDEFTYLINDGLGNFSLHSPNIFSTYFAQAGDIDNDGLIDEVLTSDNGVFWQKRIDENEYGMPKLITTFSDLRYFRLGDLDNDGDLDIVLALGYYLPNSNYDGIAYKLNDGNGNFGNTIMIDANVNNAFIMLADMDGNGFLDVVSLLDGGGSNKLHCYFNTNTTFTNTLVEHYFSHSMELYLLQDYDNNGTMDIICKRGDQLVNYEFSGSTFQAPVDLYSITIGGNLNSFSDVDNDGNLDYLITTSQPTSIFLLKKEAAGLVPMPLTPLNYLVGSSYSIQFYDYDNDGDEDLLFSRTVKYDVFTNDGLGNFSFSSSVQTRDQPTIFLADYDGLDLKGLYTKTHRRLRKLSTFNLGNQPTLSLPDTIYSCPYEIVSLNVTNNTSLNNNSEWILMSDSLNGPIIEVSPSGQFNIHTDSTKYYYVRAAGNSSYQGVPDSILFIVYPPSYGPISTIATCPSYLWTQNGITYTSSGNYYDTLTSIHGCDSLIKLELTINPIIGRIDTVASCQNYIWPQNGLSYSNSGIYNDTFVSVAGCDSLISLDLTIFQPYIDTQYIYSCTSYFWPVNGLTYNLSGHYTDTLTAITGCDSILTLHIDVVPILMQPMGISSCNDYVWPQNGVSYTSSGIYYDTLLSSTGCDSIVSLEFVRYHPYLDTQNVTTCTTYHWPVTGYDYDLSGQYDHSLLTFNGCDSILTLNLNILPNVIPNIVTTDTVSTCQNYVWPQNGLNYTITGIYYDTLSSVNGCDSVVVALDLTIFNPSFNLQTITSCNTYLWPVTGLNYNLSGTYTDTLIGQGGCDSILQLQLNIENYNSQINTFSTPSNTQNCDGGLTVETFSNSAFYHVLNNTTNVSSNGSVLINNLCPGIYNLATVFGCGDTINQTVVIPVDTNYVFHNWYSDSTFLDSLAQTIPNCNINLNDITSATIDSVWYSANIINVVWNISTSTDTILVTTSYTLNNGYGVYLLQLSVYCPITPIGQYLSLNQEFDEYFTVTESIYFGDPILNLYQIDPEDYNVNVYPNPTYDEVTVTFNADQLILKIINLQGQIVQESKIKSGETVSLVKFDSGMYLFELVSEYGVSLKRVIKN